VRHRIINGGEARICILILESGEEVAASLKRFAEENKLSSGSFKAIGALSNAHIGWLIESGPSLHGKIDPESGLALIQL
jgi:predicted DNA-binding protein with PD1-like motif